MTRTRVLAAAALLTTVVLGVQTWNKAFRVGGNDLTSYLLSAEALWNGLSPYGLATPFPYLYPPFLAFILIPLALLPYSAAVIGWFVASVAALAIILVQSAFRPIEVNRRGAPELAIAATVLVTFGVIQNNLLNGQVNFIVVLCCVLAVGAARERRESAAGLWLGAAVALKVMPAALMVYLLTRRQFRAVAVAAVSAVVLAFAPALLISAPGVVASSFTGIVERYVRDLLIPVVTSAQQDALTFSIAGLLKQATGAAPSLWIDVICATSLLAAMALLDIWKWRPRHLDFAAGAAYLTAILLISPKSETHHLAFAIPGVALCWQGVLEERRLAEPAAKAILVSAGMLMAAPIMGAAEGPVIAAAMILLIAALFYVPTSYIRPRS